MRYNNLEATLRMFPHWYDKNPYSNFTRTVKVLNRQYLDKYHKIKSLDYAKRLLKPIKIHKEQDSKEEYSIVVDVEMENLMTVNFYVNPRVNGKEEIISYEKCFTKTFKDDGHNDKFNFTYYGDTRKHWKNDSVVNVDDYLVDDEDYTDICELTVNVKDSNGELLEGATVSYELNPFEIVIPRDSFIVEVLTYDDYRWLKGFPENDDEDLFRIYQEEKSYTQYLTFEVRKQNLKDITILKDNNTVFFNDFFSKTVNDDKVIYHDYQQSQETVNKEYEGVKIADPNKDNYIIRVILNNDDFTPIFNKKILETNYPQISRWELVDTFPSLTDEYGVIIKEKNIYNAYKSNNEKGEWEQCSYNVPYTLELKPNFDIIITLYDRNNPNCPQRYKTIHKRYNGYDKTNYDCFSHDFSLDMLGKYWNIPRLELLPYEKETQCGGNIHFKKTYPPFNDRTTEDDYHYQQRINTYIQNYNKTLFPVLELWKNYQVWGTLRNRKDILSVQDHSYIIDRPYYEDTSVVEESLNKLEIIKAEAIPVKIGSKSWYETILADGLFLIPLGEYIFHCNIQTTRPVNDERVTLHLYYLDKQGNCINEDVHKLRLEEYEVNSYIADEKLIIKSDSYKVDIVLESDINYTMDNAYLKRLTIAEKTSMYMATKKDYNSCVYDLTIKADDVPTNIDFSDTVVFEKLLQKSMPLTHKCFLKMDYDYEENIEISDGFGNITVANYFNKDNDNNKNKKDYSIQVPSLIKGDDDYHLDVQFKHKGWSEDETYIITTINFKEHINDDASLDSVTLESKVMADYWTRLVHNFTTPQGTNAIEIIFHCDDLNFNYKELKLVRESPVDTDELWN